MTKCQRSSLHVSLILNAVLSLSLLTGCHTTISLNEKDRTRADLLIHNLSQMEIRFKSIDHRLYQINRSAGNLGTELSGVRSGAIKLQKQLEELQKKFFGTTKK